MIRIGYAPGAFDLFHIGHLNLLRRAKERCDYLIAGVVSDEVLIAHKGVTPVVPLAERIEIVRNCRHVDAAHAAMTDDKLEIWWDLRFNVFFKGADGNDLVVDGSKLFITSGDVADRILLFGKYEGIEDPKKAISSVVIERGAAGLDAV